MFYLKRRLLLMFIYCPGLKIYLHSYLILDLSITKTIIDSHWSVFFEGIAPTL